MALVKHPKNSIFCSISQPLSCAKKKGSAAAASLAAKEVDPLLVLFLLVEDFPISSSAVATKALPATECSKRAGLELRRGRSISAVFPPPPLPCLHYSPPT